MVEGTYIVIENLNKFGNDFRKQVEINFRKAAEVLKEKIKKNASVVDVHTRVWLAKNNFPYAARHGSIQIHKDKPYIVHHLTGSLEESITLVESIKESELFWYIFPDESKAPHAKYVIIGTKTLIGRNFLGGTLAESHDLIFDIIRGTAKGVGNIKPLKQVILERKL